MPKAHKWANSVQFIHNHLFHFNFNLDQTNLKTTLNSTYTFLSLSQIFINKTVQMDFFNLLWQTFTIVLTEIDHHDQRSYHAQFS
jgi:hypothetical protein